MRDGINWIEVGSGGRFENIVSVLISTLYPNSQRIDGSGGDGGRDHQLLSDDRLDLWQSKYFLNRLSESRSRKRQIEESLIAATALQPDSWTLATPMVPNPEELAWFDTLKEKYPFPLRWNSGDWLDARLAEHPSIVQHFMGENDRYISLLRELAEERDALIDGLPAATPRIESLAARIDAANPFYGVDFTVSGGRITSADLRPKYRDAPKDSPLVGRFNIVVGSSESDAKLQSQIEEALAWGESVHIPSENIQNLSINAPHGFGISNGTAEVVIGPVEAEQVSLPMQLAIREPAGKILATLPLILESRRLGDRGLSLRGRDATRTANVRVRIDHRDNRLHINISYEDTPPATLPAALLPVLRFIQHSVAPNRLTFRVENVHEADAMEFPQAASSIDERYIDFVAGLAHLQAHTGNAFPLPPRWTNTDEREVRQGVKLIRGERVRIASGSINFSMQDDARLEDFLKSPDEWHSIAFAAAEPCTAEVCGYEFDLGPYTTYVQKARVVIETSESGTGHRFRVKPDSNYGIEIALGSVNHPPGLPPVPPESE